MKNVKKKNSQSLKFLVNVYKHFFLKNFNTHYALKHKLWTLYVVNTIV